MFAASTSIQYGNISHVVEELGLSKRILHNWKKLFREGKLNTQNISDINRKRKELTALRKEINLSQLFLANSSNCFSSFFTIFSPSLFNSTVDVGVFVGLSQGMRKVELRIGPAITAIIAFSIRVYI